MESTVFTEEGLINKPVWNLGKNVSRSNSQKFKIV